jgi:hypothetical protein
MSNDLATPFLMSQRPEPGVEEPVGGDIAPEQDPRYSDEALLDVWKEVKAEALSNRWMFERCSGSAICGT